jgi:hypothetical protein
LKSGLKVDFAGKRPQDQLFKPVLIGSLHNKLHPGGLTQILIYSSNTTLRATLLE